MRRKLRDGVAASAERSTPRSGGAPLRGGGLFGCGGRYSLKGWSLPEKLHDALDLVAALDLVREVSAHAISALDALLAMPSVASRAHHTIRQRGVSSCVRHLAGRLAGRAATAATSVASRVPNGSAASACDRYTYEPCTPTPSVGGASFAPRNCGAKRQNAFERRADVLVYTTPPLASPLEVIGFVELVLYVRSSCAHTDFVGRLCDVDTSGASWNICDGLLRLPLQTAETGAHDVNGAAIRPGEGHAAAEPETAHTGATQPLPSVRRIPHALAADVSGALSGSEGGTEGETEGSTEGGTEGGTEGRGVSIRGVSIAEGGGGTGYVQLRFRLGATAYHFKAGHCIRLQVCSGAHPRWLRNHGTGEAPIDATSFCTAAQEVFRCEGMASHLLLPVRAHEVARAFESTELGTGRAKAL